MAFLTGNVPAGTAQIDTAKNIVGQGGGNAVENQLAAVEAENAIGILPDEVDLMQTHHHGDADPRRAPERGGRPGRQVPCGYQLVHLLHVRARLDVQNGNEYFPASQTSGGGGAHNNMPPYLVERTMIKTR